MDFERRLQKAIQRGQQARAANDAQEQTHGVTADELRNRHGKFRIDLTEHIEKCLSQLADHFPGFDFQTLIGEEGWGARISRDDIDVRARKSLYSRFEMLIQPFSKSHIVSLAAKGTIRNKEVLNRSHFQFITEFDSQSFTELIDLWVLEFAEKFASTD